jgi:hypothetical protein
MPLEQVIYVIYSYFTCKYIYIYIYIYFFFFFKLVILELALIFLTYCISLVCRHKT